MRLGTQERSVMRRTIVFLAFLAAVGGLNPLGWADEPLRAGFFAVDASPPIGSPLAYDLTQGVVHPLSCRGVILTGEGGPVVLCAVDWIGIGNDGQTEFRQALAKAAGTTPARVAVQTLHQHDAPACDFSVDRLLDGYGINREVFDAGYERAVILRASEAVKAALDRLRPVSHVGVSQAEVENVASNRRILGPDGKVQYIRYTACTDPKVREMPVGTIDPNLKMVTLWDGDSPIVALTYYATHPQSYYRTGLANPDFPGLARDQRQKETGVPQIHFDGAGGNIGAGKWNDGAHENRQILADRVARAMAKAWESVKKVPIKRDDFGWKSEPVALPPAPHLDESRLLAVLENRSAKVTERAKAANDLVWLRRCHSGGTIDVSCLRLGPARLLQLPGELFVEYQLAAQADRPDLFVALAAYGDYAPGYIGTEIAYAQGGYETLPGSSLVAPSVERVLTDVIHRLLRD
jgi:hypothetical protein